MSSFTRLPKAVHPEHYVLTIEPDLEKFTHSGSVLIDLKIDYSKFTEKTIRINTAEIEFQDATLNGQTSTNIEYDVENEEAHLTFNENAFHKKNGVDQLFISFTGCINNKMKGFYRSKYTKPDGTIGYIGTTHFEPTGARLAFPCFDEPSFRSTFQINLVNNDKEIETLSCMNVLKNTEEENGRTTVVYANTPLMPTYLVAFIFGKFDHVERFTKSNLPVRVYTPLGQGEHGVLAADFGAKCVDFYEEFFDIKYPLPKLDMIGIEDYPLGGMENWGLITYAMRCLIYNPKTDTKMKWQTILAIVAHEVAHMWFGNLVTIEWWSDLWLKEGFATFLQYYCCDKICPEAKIWDVFMSIRYPKALELDGLASSHPIQCTIGHPRECSQVFDQISYAKGGSVIRMLFHWMGEEKFRKGTSDYLKKHAYQSCKTAQLWEAFEDSINSPDYPVLSVGKQWTALMHYPIIEASLVGGGKSLKLVQECCMGTGQVWQVPLNLEIGGVNSKVLMIEKEYTMEVPENALINVNLGAASFIRVRYSDELLNRLLSKISALGSYDQMQLQADYYDSVLKGKQTLQKYLALVFDNYNNIKLDYAVIRDIFTTFGKISQILEKAGCSEGFKIKLQEFCEKMFETIGWEQAVDEPIDCTLLRPMVLGNLIGCGVESIISEGCDRFKAGNYAPQMAAVVMKCFLKSGEKTAMKQLMDKYDETPLGDSAMRASIRGALFGQVSSEADCEMFMEWMMSEKLSGSERGWGLSVLPDCAGGNFSNYFSKVFMPNFSKFHGEYKESQFMFTSLIKSTIGIVSTQEELDTFLKFIEERGIKEGDKAVAQAKDTAIVNIKVLSENGSGLKSYFS